MNIPFTIDEFLGVFGEYNAAIWPAQVIGYLAGIISLVLIVKRWKYANQLTAYVLAIFWIWTGVFYHIVYFSGINQPAFFFGALFVLQGILLVILGGLKSDIRFITKRKLNLFFAGIMITYATIAYPLIAYRIGHVYPRSPIFPFTPCPLTIFTFGILLLARSTVKWYLWIIPFLWSLIGFTAALKLSMFEDFGLLVSGVIGLILILYSNRLQRATGSSRAK